jgi:hypothetical protein
VVYEASQQQRLALIQQQLQMIQMQVANLKSIGGIKNYFIIMPIKVILPLVDGSSF